MYLFQYDGHDASSVIFSTMEQKLNWTATKKKTFLRLTTVTIASNDDDDDNKKKSTTKWTDAKSHLYTENENIESILMVGGTQCYTQYMRTVIQNAKRKFKYTYVCTFIIYNISIG